MTKVFRLVRGGRSAEALSGEGARLYGGRWNPPGVPVLYASGSRALAVLETFVHLTVEARGMRFVLLTLGLPSRFGVAKSPRATRTHSIAACQRVGEAWAGEGNALVLEVPSVIVPQESNYVLNVAHAQFAAVRLLDSERFSFDARLWGVRSTADS